MVNFLNVQTAQPTRNEVDWQGISAPIMNGLNNYRQGMDQQYAERQRKEQQGYQRGRDAKQDSRDDRQIWGKRALAVDAIQNPGQRSQVWNQVIKGLGKSDFTPEELDPMTGPKLLAAEAGLFRDPRDDRVKDLEMQKTQAEINNLNRRGMDDQSKVMEVGGRLVRVTPDGTAKEIYDAGGLDGTIADMLKGVNEPVPAQSQQGGIQPQSFNRQAPNPNLILTGAEPGTPGTPQQEALVDTPLGKMTSDKARKLGFALALTGKGDAGKMLMGEGSALEKTARTEVDKREIAQTEGLARIRSIRSSFDPNYLTFQNQIGMWGKALASKAGMLAPKDREALYKYATFRRDAANNMNQAIRDNSGQTVTVQEMTRNQVEYANAGTGMFDGDDPVTFKAKLDRAEETLALGNARLRYLRTKGFSGDINAASNAISIESMRGLINQRARELEGQIKAQSPNLDPATLNREVDLRVKQEFGI